MPERRDVDYGLIQSQFRHGNGEKLDAQEIHHERLH